jgi:hypothetical protein
MGKFCRSNYLNFVLKKVLASSVLRRLCYKVNGRHESDIEHQHNSISVYTQRDYS